MGLQLRGIGPTLVSAYLVDLGGHEVEPGTIAGDGWEARVTAGDPVTIGAIRLGVTGVELSGEPELLSRLRQALDKKVLRAGG